jgi:hypothetical protein
MLLIDDDEPKIGKRRKNRRARSNHDVHLAAGDPPPVRPSLGLGKSAVQDANLSREAGINTIEKLWSQRDFRYQDDGPQAFVPNPLGGAQVNLRFAASGGSMDEEGLKSTLLQALLDDSVSLLLLAVERKSGRGMGRGGGRPRGN